MSLYLGIDGGGSKTSCAIGDDACLLATGGAGGCNVVRLGEETARANLHAAVEQACRAANVEARAIGHAVVGVAGAASVARHATFLGGVLRDLGIAEVQVVGDNVIAMEAAFAGLPGVVVVAGTGSIAFGRNSRGETARAGGYGFAISDEGSGHWIGKKMVNAALRSHDAGRDDLLHAVLSCWNISSVDELVQQSNGHPRPDFAQLFPRVAELAIAGDAIASGILGDAGRELAGLADIVMRRLWSERQTVRVALGGGVFAHSGQVRKSFYLRLREEHPVAAVNFKPVEPVTGALWLARRAGSRVRNAGTR